MRELLLEIYSSVSKNKLRTILTGFSIAWGIFMLSVLLGSGNGLKNATSEILGDMMSNGVSVSGGFTTVPYAGYETARKINLGQQAVDILRNEFSEVDEMTLLCRYSNMNIVLDTRYNSSSISGVSTLYAKIEGVKIIEGRFINDKDIASQRKVVVLDKTTSKVLAPSGGIVGQQVDIGSTIYTVIGVHDYSDNKNVCYIPISTGNLIYQANNPNNDTEIIITVKNIYTFDKIKAFEKRIRERLAEVYNFAPDDTNAVWIWNKFDSYKKVTAVFSGLNFFIWIIGMGTMMAGVVGVSNIMLVTISERTFEFGIRKALGAKPSSIIKIILLESVMITALFGYIGMVLGVGAMEVVNIVLTNMNATGGLEVFKNPTLDISIIFSATIVLVVAGLIAGYIPARRAARIKTIDALRHNK